MGVAGHPLTAPLDVREVLRAFHPEHLPERGTELVRWSSALDASEGAGARIALLDGGADLSDPDLEGAEIVTVDFVGEPRSSAHELHGTRDLAMLVGRGRCRVRGLVPAARVLHARVLGDEGGEPAVLAEAIDWVVGEGAEVVVMPLGMADPDAEVATSIERGLVAGVTFLAAAGNRFPHPLEFPARLTAVVAVGATDPRGLLLPSCCRYPRLDRIALGEIPVEGWRGGGTSVACVIAGGVEALRRAAAGRRRVVR